MTRPYARYAEIYDRTGQDRFGAAMARFTVRYLHARGLTVSSAIDLACGTGSAAIALAKQGISVTGIDLEPAMLSKARSTAAAEGCNIDFRLGDMRRFGSQIPVDLIVCFFDSLNYLRSEDDFAACFTSAAQCVHEAGWLVFDVNTIHRLATDWNDSTFVAYDEDDLLSLVRSTFDPTQNRSPLYLTTFQRVTENDSYWTRWDEEHVAYGYALARIEALLETSSFRVIERYAVDDASMSITGPGSEESGRVLYVAQRMLGDGDASQ